MNLPKYETFKMWLKPCAIWLIYVLIGYLPFVSVAPSLGAVKDVICILVCLCVLCNREYKINVVSICVFLYVFFVATSAFCNENLGLAEKVNVIRYRCIYAVTFCMLFNGFRFTRKELIKFGERILQILYCTGVIVALIGVIEFINPEPIYAMYGDNLTPHLKLIFESGSERRLVSTMGNPINLGLQMCFPIIAALYFAHKKDADGSIIKKVICGASVALFAWVAIYSYSRTAYVVIIGAVLVFYLVQILFGGGPKKEKTFLIVAGAVAVVFACFLLANEAIAERFADISVEKLLNNPRFLRVVTAFSNAEVSPLSIAFGYGAGSHITESMQYVFEFGYASLLYETGVLGLLVFGVAVINSLANCVKAIRNERKTAMMSSAYLCIIAGFCVAMIAEDVYFQLPMSLYLWLSVFIIDALKENEDREGTLLF